MREFTNKFHRELTTGLNPDASSYRRSVGLETATNVEATPYGLESAQLITDPFAGAKTDDWPWPQLIHGREITLLAFKDTIHLVNESTWTSALISLVELDGSTAETLTADGQWHFADAGDSWYLFNGIDTVFRTGILKFDDFTTESLTFAQSAITIKTGCVHRGRVITAGFDYADGLGEQLSAMLVDWEGDLPKWNEVTSEGIGPNFVAWSSIGGADFPLWFMAPSGSAYAEDLRLNTDSVLDRTMQNEMGFMPMMFQGAILKVLPLDKHVIIYGEEGIAALTLVEGQYAYRTILPFGIESRGAAGGDDSGHMFMSDKGQLWLIRPDLSLTRLDYSDHLTGLLTNDPIVTLDSREKKFYIGVENEGYVLTKVGDSRALTEHRQQLTSLVDLQGDSLGLFTDNATATALVVTGPFDLGLRTIKTINSVGLALDSNVVVEVALDYRYDKGAAFVRSAFVPVNPEGNAHLRISAVDFRVVIRCADYTDFLLDNIDVRWHSVDKRVIRGPIAATPDADAVN